MNSISPIWRTLLRFSSHFFPPEDSHGPDDGGSENSVVSARSVVDSCDGGGQPQPEFQRSVSDEDEVHREISHCYKDTFGNGHPLNLRPYGPYDVTDVIVCVMDFAASFASLVALVRVIVVRDPENAVIRTRIEKEKDLVEEEVNQET